MNKQQYHSYLKSDGWQQISKSVKARDGYKCRLCNSGLDLHVHHRSYEFIGKEKGNEKELVTLCARCHGLFHCKTEQDSKPKPPKKKRRIGNKHRPQSTVTEIPEDETFFLTHELIQGLRTDVGGITGATISCVNELGIDTRIGGWVREMEGVEVTRDWYIRAEEGRHWYA